MSIIFYHFEIKKKIKEKKGHVFEGPNFNIYILTCLQVLVGVSFKFLFDVKRDFGRLVDGPKKEKKKKSKEVFFFLSEQHHFIISDACINMSHTCRGEGARWAGAF